MSKGIDWKVSSWGSSNGGIRKNKSCDLYKTYGFILMCHFIGYPDILDVEVTNLLGDRYDGHMYDYLTKEMGFSKDELQEKVVEFFNSSGLDDLVHFYAVPIHLDENGYMTADDHCKIARYSIPSHVDWKFDNFAWRVTQNEIQNRHL